MFTQKLIFFTRFMALAFSFLLWQGEASSQVCNCPSGNNSIVVTGTVNTSSLGTDFFKYCFKLQPGAILNIDNTATFTECTFWKDKYSEIRISGNATFSASGQNQLGTCTYNNEGLIITATGQATIENLIMDIGYGGLGTGIVNMGNLIVNGTLAIFNTYDIGINCQSCQLLNLNGVGITSPQTGILTTGSPNAVIISNSSIYAHGPALLSLYSFPGFFNLFRVQNSTFSSGTGSSGNGSAAIQVQAFSPFSFFGNINYIKDCTINMEAATWGVNLNNIDGLEVSGNDISVKTNVSIQGVTQKGVYLQSAPNTEVADNNVFFTGNQVYNFSTGLDMVNSAGCTISGNTFDGLETGVKVSGNCTTTDGLSDNIFKGSQKNGLWVTGSAQLGTQTCHTNRWEGTFSSWGYRCDGNGPASLITTNNGSSPEYMPTFSNSSSVDYQDLSCAPLMMIASGSQNGIETTNTVFDPVSVKVFPNPTSGNFTIGFPLLENGNDFTVKVTDLTGKIVMEQKIGQGVWQEEFNIENLSAGIYLVHILSGDFRQTEKLIIID